MRAGILLMTLGLIGFSAHSIRARSIKPDENIEAFKEAYKYEFGKDPSAKLLSWLEEAEKPDAESVTDHIDSAELQRTYQEIMKEMFEDSVEEKAKPVRRDVETVDRRDETESDEGDDIDWSKEIGEVAICHSGISNPQGDDVQVVKSRRALDTTTPDPNDSLDWSKHDLQDEAESWERS